MLALYQMALKAYDRYIRNLAYIHTQVAAAFAVLAASSSKHLPQTEVQVESSSKSLLGCIDEARGC